MAFHDNAWMTITSTGTGPLTLGAALTGAQTFAAAGVVDQETLSYKITDPSGIWEEGTGTYTASGTTMARSVTKSSSGTSPIAVTANSTVFIALLAADLAKFAQSASLASTAPAGGVSLDTTASTATLANNATVAFANFSGMILVHNESNGHLALWLCAAGQASSLGNVNGSDGALAYDSSISGYRFTNNTGSSQTFGFAAIRTRATA